MKRNQVPVLAWSPSPEGLEALRRSLADHDFVVEIVSEAHDLADKLAERTWSLLLIDSQLPELDLPDFVEKLRMRYPIKPEILVLGEQPGLSLRDLHHLGVWGTLKKPFVVEEFLAIAARLVPVAAKTRRLSDPSPAERNALLGNAPRSTKRHFDLQAEVHAVGRGGFSLFLERSQKIPEVGQVVKFDIQLAMLPSTSLQGEGLVRWVYRENGLFGIGIEFIQVTEDAEQLVTAFADLFKVRAFVPVANLPAA